MSSPWMPSTSQRVSRTRFIQNLFTPIQNSAMPCITVRSTRCAAGKGSNSLSRATVNSGQQQIRVLRASSRALMTPRSGAGRKCSMGSEGSWSGGVLCAPFGSRYLQHSLRQVGPVPRLTLVH